MRERREREPWEGIGNDRLTANLALGLEETRFWRVLKGREAGCPWFEAKPTGTIFRLHLQHHLCWFHRQTISWNALVSFTRNCPLRQTHQTRWIRRSARSTEKPRGALGLLRCGRCRAGLGPGELELRLHQWSKFLAPTVWM